MTNCTIKSQVDFAAVGHINGNEPRALDYNGYNQPLLYNPDQYRSSDHDPVIVYLDLEPYTKLFLPFVAK